jgi:GMP synthase (glutamine-hydrolysing)
VRALHLVNLPVAPAGLFLPPLRERGFEVVDVDVSADAVPRSLEGFDAVVVCGGSANTHETDEHPWLDAEVSLLQEALATDVPTLGLCLGAQLLTVASGGTVNRSQTEIGWFEVEMDPAAAGDPVLGGIPERFTALQWHDYACTPPDGATTLARNGSCLQAFRFGEVAWGTQFHIEVTHQLMLNWWDEGEEHLREAGYDRARFMRELAANHGAHETIGREMAERFATVAADHSVAR